MSLQKQYLGMLALLGLLLLPAALMATDALTPFSIDGKTGSYATLQAAVDAADSGDTILIASCTLENNEYTMDYASSVNIDPNERGAVGRKIYVDKTLTFKNSGTKESAKLKDFVFVLRGKASGMSVYTFDNIHLTGMSMIFVDSINSSSAIADCDKIILQNSIVDVNLPSGARQVEGKGIGDYNGGAFLLCPYSGTTPIQSLQILNNKISVVAGRCIYSCLRCPYVLVEENTFGRDDREDETENENVHRRSAPLVFERMYGGDKCTVVFKNNTCLLAEAGDLVYLHSDQTVPTYLDFELSGNKVELLNKTIKEIGIYDIVSLASPSGNAKIWNNYVNDFCCNKINYYTNSTGITIDAQIGHTAGDLKDVDTKDDKRSVVYLATGTLDAGNSSVTTETRPQLADSFDGTTHNIQEIPAGKACPHCARYQCEVDWKSYEGAEGSVRKDPVQYKIVDDAGAYPEAPATADLPKPADDSVFIKWDTDLTQPVLYNTTVIGLWEGYFHVIHSSDDSDDSDEPIKISDLLAALDDEATTFDITQPAGTAYSGITDGYIYGGLWTDADKDELRSDVCGKELPIPAVGEKIYLREVPENYAKPYTLSCRLGGIYHTIVFAPIDLDGSNGLGYTRTGFVFNEVTDKPQYELYSSIVVHTPNQEDQTFTAKNVDKDLPDTAPLACMTVSDEDAAAWTEGRKPVTVNSYFVTPDRVKVFAAAAKKITFQIPNMPSLATESIDSWTEKDDEPEMVGVERLPMLRMTAFTNGDMESAQVVLTLHADGLVSQVAGNIGGDFRALAGSPALEGSLFAGWFADAGFTCPMDLSCLVEDADAYARFVKADGLLEVKAEATAARGRLLRVRLLSACLEDAASCGFLWENGANSAETVADGHYLRVDGRDAASLFNAEDAALFFCDIPFASLDAEAELSVTPFWTTADGAKVLGRKSAIDLKKFF